MSSARRAGSSTSTPARRKVDVAVSEIGGELVTERAANATRVYDLHRRWFEQLVAELHRRRGFEATLTPASGDEGLNV